MDIKSDINKSSKNAAIKRKIISYYLFNNTSTLPDLAKVLNISVPTVTKLISELTEKGYIINYGKLETNEGRPPTLYGLNPDSGYFIGVDIKKFSLHFALMNLVGDIVEYKMGINCILENSQNGLNTLCHYINEFINGLTINKNKILKIGNNISGRVNPDSGYSFSIFNFEERSLSDVISEKIGYDVYIDNDTRAMTYGEFIKGNVKGERNIIFINLSWGVGSGLTLNGKLFMGKSGFSGEFGHFNVFDNEIICQCGKRGCLETEVSGAALYRQLLQCIDEGKQSILSSRIKKNISKLTLYDIVDATNKEDLLCIELIEEIGQKLGRYLAGLINLLNPELVIIGGVFIYAGSKDEDGMQHHKVEVQKGE